MDPAAYEATKDQILLLGKLFVNNKKSDSQESIN